MNKQSNVYTTVYIIILVLVVGTALASTALALRPKQQENIDADKMRQILAAVHITPEKNGIVEDFNRYIVEQKVVNSAGETIEGNAFTINMPEQIKLPADKRSLPVFVCKMQGRNQIYPAGLRSWPLGTDLGIYRHRQRRINRLWGIFRTSGRDSGTRS